MYVKMMQIDRKFKKFEYNYKKKESIQSQYVFMKTLKLN